MKQVSGSATEIWFLEAMEGLLWLTRLPTGHGKTNANLKFSKLLIANREILAGEKNSPLKEGYFYD